MGRARRLWALDGARLTMPRGDLVLGDSGTVTLPVPSFLVEHDRGLVLVDTGLAPEAADDPYEVYGSLVDAVNIEFGPEQRVDRQIESLGYRLTDVRHVVCSHTHFDHTGGLRLFPHAELYAGADDLPYAFWPNPGAAPFFHTADLDATRQFHWNPLTGDHDVFGDGSVVVLLLPGHTPGNCSVLVQLEHSAFLLSADTVHLRSALDGDLPMPSDFNTQQAVESIRRLRRLSTAHDAPVWIAHDPQDWAAHQHAPHAYE
ncbi:N-acyl homoserine lactonase family protein [Salinifilum aidingensis]